VIEKSSKIEILVIDDSFVQADYLKFLLEKHNYRVKSLNSGEEALNYLKENVPSLVITDIIMPEMNGFELCKAIKKNERTSKVPVILLTALSEPEDIIKGLASGADNFITKPYSDEFLLSRVYYTLINAEIRKTINTEIGIDIVFGGKKYMIDSNRTQILDLLLSTYESAIEKNKVLEKTILQLENTQKELIEAKETAELANKYKSEFLANMSHEIRTPMNAILGIVEIMLDSSIAEEHQNSLRLLKHSAESLLNLLNDILDLSKVEAGKLTIKNSLFDLHSLIQNIEALFEVSAKKKNLDFQVKISSEVPRYIFADALRLKQIFINLISNALKFTEEGYVKVELFVETSRYKNLIITVEDTGIGISKDKLEQIFEAFVQVDLSTTKRWGGAGLGLSICKGLVDLMSGTIKVTSELNKGSKFYVSIPLIHQSSYPKETKFKLQTDFDDEVYFKTSNQLKILIVDDNEINHLIANRMLTKKGHIVTSVYNGIEAIESIKKNKYDLVFMDVNMPEMDGLEATLRIREIEMASSSPQVPIIAMTAYAKAEDKVRCLKTGMNDYISKPINVKELDLILSKY